MSFFEGQRGLSRAVLVGTLALTAVGAPAQAKSNMPDAQVEANVLRQLATAPDLSTQSIQSSTVYGTVTLSGVVQTEALRSKAENLAARAEGVKKVVDELTLGDPATAANDPSAGAPPADQQAYAQQGPPTGQGNADPAQGNMAPPPPQNNQAYGNQPPAYQNPNPQPPYNGQQQASNQPYYGPNQPPPPGYNNGQQAPNQPYYGPGAPEYSNNTPPSSAQPYPPARRPMYSNSAPYGNGYAAPYPPNGQPGPEQQAGIPVTVPAGTMLQIRINRGIDSNHIQPGAPFDGIVMNDVVAGGAVAIPRGASVQGVISDAHKAGALKGRGELTLQLTSLTLGGQTYPIASVPWDREGRDKTIGTVNSALGMGVLGAIVGGVAGGGTGAAIGAGVGAGVGVAGSAGSGGGRVIVPPESVLTFHLDQPTTVTTVSQQEMARLSYTAGPARPPVRRYYSPRYGYYDAPYTRPY